MKVHAFSLVASAGESGHLSPSATLVHRDGDRRWELTMEWQNLPLLKSPSDNPAEFLYAVLWALMTDFDDHLVTAAQVTPVEGELG